MGDNNQLRIQLPRKAKTQKTYVSDEFWLYEEEDEWLTDWQPMEKNKSAMKSKASAGHIKNSTSRKRTSYNDLYDDVETKVSCSERVDKVLALLENEYNQPFFLKYMLPSNVSHGFWLHLPKKFCSVHFPNHNFSITLVDEWGNEYKTTYIIERHGLSAGWRGFSIAHRLLKGDALIFHLMAPRRLQVHIVRANASDVVSAALCLMSMDASREETGSEATRKDKRKRKTTIEYVEPFFLDLSMPSENVKQKNVQEQSVGNSCDGFDSDVVEG